MTETNNELPEINKRIRDIIDNNFNGNVLKFSKYIGLNSSSKINRLFSKDKRNNEYPDVSVDIIQRIANSLNYSADDIIFGFEKNNKQMKQCDERIMLTNYSRTNRIINIKIIKEVILFGLFYTKVDAV